MILLPSVVQPNGKHIKFDSKERLSSVMANMNPL